MSSQLNHYTQHLISQGYAVIPVFNQAQVETFNQELAQYTLAAPEVKHPHGQTAGDTVLTMGGFGASGLPSSFHNQTVRNLRQHMMDVFKQLTPGLVPMGQNPEAWKFHQIMDRFSIRRKDTSTSAEKWHQDNSPVPSPTDMCFGGWVNLDCANSLFNDGSDEHQDPKDLNQYFSCVPSSHMLFPDKANGFTSLNKDELNQVNPKSNKIKVVIPPGHWIVFFNSIVHEVKPRTMNYNSIRVYLGFRMTTTDIHLFDMHRNAAFRVMMEANKTPSFNFHQQVFDQQGIPPLPSGQMPPNYAKLHLVNWKPRLVDWSATIQSAAIDMRSGIVHRFMPSLREMHMPLYQPYSTDEQLLYTGLHSIPA
jgi:hypothetical protein